MIFYRLREGPRTFVEVFVTYLNGIFCLPTEIPKRFHGRLTEHVCANQLVYQVFSDAKGCQSRKKETFSDGAWIVESDSIAKGGLSDVDAGLNIPYLAVYFGVAVDVTVPWKDLYRLTRTEDGPVVLYHGTAKQNVKSILKTGLVPSFGMFGTAVYFGSFWKAYRFATLTQDYQPRDGAIFRALCFWKTAVVRNLCVPVCHCDLCKGKETYADHLETWTGCQCVYLFPAKVKDPQNPFGARYEVKNFEVASKDTENVLLDTVCYVAGRPGPYNPCDRSVSVL